MAQGSYVLVVEDDAFYSNIYKTKLAKEDIRAVIAGNGNQALAQAKKEKPKLILMDLIMPEKDGFQTLEELKADASLRDVPVIILSNLSQKEDRERVLQLGAVEYLVKANVPLEQVIECVKTHLL